MASASFGFGVQLGKHLLGRPLDRPHGVADQAVADPRGHPDDGGAEGGDPDGDFLAHRGLRGRQRLEVGAVVLALEGLETLVRAAHDVTYRRHRLAQVRQGLVLRCAVEAARPREHAGAEPEDEAPAGNAVHVEGRHRRFEGAARRGDRDAGGELNPLRDGGRRREGEEGRAVDLGSEAAVKALRLRALRHLDQDRRGQRRQDAPVTRPRGYGRGHEASSL
jgi:hypothetical protein